MNHTKEEVILALGIESLEPTLQEQVLGTFLQTLDIKTRDAVSAKLSEDQLQELNKVVTEQGDDAGEKWLQPNIDGYDTIEEEQYQALLTEVNNTSN